MSFSMIEQESWSIDQWCRRRNYSRSTYYKMRRAGMAPRTIEVLGCVRITKKQDADWEKAREAETAREVAA